MSPNIRREKGGTDMALPPIYLLANGTLPLDLFAFPFFLGGLIHCPDPLIFIFSLEHCHELWTQIQLSSWTIHHYNPQMPHAQENKTELIISSLSSLLLYFI